MPVVVYGKLKIFQRL